MSSLSASISSPTALHRASRWSWSFDKAAEERPSPSHHQQLESQEQLDALEEKQQALRTRLAIVQEQQLRENYGMFARSVFSLPYPDSLEMIICGLHEQLDRVSQEIAACQQLELLPR